MVANRIEKDLFRTEPKCSFFHPKEMESDPSDVRPDPVDDHQDMAMTKLEIYEKPQQTLSEEESQNKSPNLKMLERILHRFAIDYPEIGYLQGMNESAATILYTVKDEDSSYRVFEYLMKNHLWGYCLEDAKLMGEQLERLSALIKYLDPILYDRLSFSSENKKYFFACRWFLLLFKRELGGGLESHAQILECIMTAPCQGYDVIIAAALLLLNREELLLRGHRFDLTIEHFSSTRGCLERTLTLADRIHCHLTIEGRSVKQCDPLLSFIN